MILVTGASGFLGSRLLQKMAVSHQPVRALTRNPNSIPPALQLQNVQWIEGAVLDVVSLAEAMQNVERVYHCAAIVSFETKDHRDLMRVNVSGTANVVNAALVAGVKKLLHVSSIAALGRTSRDELITEDSRWDDSGQNSTYALSKYLAEREVWRGTQEGLPAVIVNPSVIIGPGNWMHGTPKLFHASRNGMAFYPKGMNGFVGIDDVVDCMIKLMNGHFENERYIISAENLSYKDFFTLTTKAFGVKTPAIGLSKNLTRLAWLGSAALHRTLGIAPILTRETARTVNGTYRYSNEKIKRALNYNFKPASEFVTDTAIAYKQSRDAA